MLTVEIFHNVTKDEKGRFVGSFGYEPGQSVVKVFEFDTRYPDDALTMADLAFSVGNGRCRESTSYYARGLRSMSAGDLVRVRGVWVACDPVGWTVGVPEPTDVTDSYEPESCTKPWKATA
jgi:hypothetical protein